MNDDTLTCPGCGAQTIRKPDAFISPFEVVARWGEDSVLVRCRLCWTEMEVNRIPAMK